MNKIIARLNPTKNWLPKAAREKLCPISISLPNRLKIDALVKDRKMPFSVIPAKAGIQ